MNETVGPIAEALTVQSLREKVMSHCAEFLDQPIADRSASGLKAVVEAIVAIGEVVEKHQAKKAAPRSNLSYPFSIDENGNEVATDPPLIKEKAERKSAKGRSVPGVDT